MPHCTVSMSQYWRVSSDTSSAPEYLWTVLPITDSQIWPLYLQTWYKFLRSCTRGNSSIPPFWEGRVGLVSCYTRGIRGTVGCSTCTGRALPQVIVNVFSCDSFLIHLMSGLKLDPNILLHFRLSGPITRRFGWSTVIFLLTPAHSFIGPVGPFRLI